MSHLRPTFRELLKAYNGPYNDRYGDDEVFAVEESDAGEGYVLVDTETNKVVFHEPYDVSFPKLAECVGHAVGIDAYAYQGYIENPEDIVNLAITCHDCNKVIYDLDNDGDYYDDSEYEEW